MLDDEEIVLIQFARINVDFKYYGVFNSEEDAIECINNDEDVYLNSCRCFSRRKVNELFIKQEIVFGKDVIGYIISNYDYKNIYNLDDDYLYDDIRTYIEGFVENIYGYYLDMNSGQLFSLENSFVINGEPNEDCINEIIELVEELN